MGLKVSLSIPVYSKQAKVHTFEFNYAVTKSKSINQLYKNLAKKHHLKFNYSETSWVISVMDYYPVIPDHQTLAENKLGVQ